VKLVAATEHEHAAVCDTCGESSTHRESVYSRATGRPSGPRMPRVQPYDAAPIHGRVYGLSHPQGADPMTVAEIVREYLEREGEA
jgi:hypothetical protein